MRATSMRRLVGGAAALMLVGATLLSTGSVALAGETRDITIDFTTLTAVSAGGATRTDITITNVSGHTLSNSHFLIGLDHAVNATDVTVVSVYGADAGACPVITTPVTTLDCPFGNIGAKANQKTKHLTVIFGVGASGPHGILVELKVAETGSDVGSNTNYKTATLSTDASVGDCDHLATFKLPGDGTVVLPVLGEDCATSDHQRSGLIVPPSDSGNLAAVNDSITQLPGDCSVGFICVGNAVSGTVNTGTTPLTWQIFYSNSVLGNVNPSKIAFIHGTDIIPAGNKGLCKNATSTNCQDPYHVESDGVTFFVRTPTNGLIKGMH
jgi:hypothetical protein